MSNILRFSTERINTYEEINTSTNCTFNCIRARWQFGSGQYTCNLRRDQLPCISQYIYIYILKKKKKEQKWACFTKMYMCFWLYWDCVHALLWRIINLLPIHLVTQQIENVIFSSPYNTSMLNNTVNIKTRKAWYVSIHIISLSNYRAPGISIYYDHLPPNYGDLKQLLSKDDTWTKR